jgi:hypothetical protein
MLASSYEVGRFIGTLLVVLFIPAVLTWWAVRLNQRSSGLWWIPLAVAIFFSLSGLLGPVIRATGQLREDQTARVNPETVFPSTGTYRFERITQKAVVDRALQDHPAGLIEDLVVRDVLTEDGTPVAFVEVFAMKPEAVDDEGFTEGFAEGAAEEIGGPVEPQRIKERLTFAFESTKGDVAGWHWVVWQRPGTNLLIMVGALTAENARSVAAAMIDLEPPELNPL